VLRSCGNPLQGGLQNRKFTTSPALRNVRFAWRALKNRYVSEKTLPLIAKIPPLTISILVNRASDHSSRPGKES